jgi:hypothetical protein
VCDHHAGGGLADFDVPCDPGGDGILITASGESFARLGYAFPPVNPGDVFFVDGWAITFDRVLTTFDHVTLSSGPDKSPTDPSLCDDGSGRAITCGTGSSVVAEVDGPFAIDLHQMGPLADADGVADDATPIAALTGRNRQDNDAFDETVPYAFGFEVVPATLSARNVNLDAAAVLDYQAMVASGYTTLLVGTATWQGTSCSQTAPYDFTALPTTLHLRIGLTAPTVYRNAQNPALTGDPLPGEEAPRGVQTENNQSVIAQATFHLDHVFWESFVHDSPAHFDSFAARYAGAAGTPTVKLEDFQGFRFTPFVDIHDHLLPWRSCVPSTVYTPPGTGAMAFDTLSIAVDPIGDPTRVIHDFHDYVLYNHSTFGHLNADGLAFTDRQYPSPP